MAGKKIIIIGAVAAGTSAAAKLRRLNEELDITIYEKDKYISYASCGLPYFVSGKINNLHDLLINSVESFSKRFNLSIKILHEVIKINPLEKSVVVRNIENGKEFKDNFDYLLIATGTSPAQIPLFKNEKNICVLKTIDDALVLRDYINTYMKEDINNNLKNLNNQMPEEKRGVKKDCKVPNEKINTNMLIVGAGFIGLELLEAFLEKNLSTVIIEKTGQILPNFDSEITDYAEDYLKKLGVKILKNSSIKEYASDASGKIISVKTTSCIEIRPDIIFLGIGVKPENNLAKDCGINLGSKGGIVVDEQLRTNFDCIYAAGDCVEVNDLVSGKSKLFCLASIASKQGRIAAANIVNEINGSYKAETKNKKSYIFPGSIGTSIIKILDLQISKTGLSYKEAKKINKNAFKLETHALSHAEYYPGAEMIHMITIFDKKTGKILGFEAVGKEAVDKKTDIMSVSIYSNLKITDLAKYDLAYHPSCGSAKDSINIIGMIAENLFNGDVEFIDVEDLRQIINDENLDKDYQILDVRNPKEFKAGHIEGTLLIPLNQLRDNIEEVDRSKKIIVYCRTGYRAYVAYRLLKNNGFKYVKCLNGSYLSWERKI